MSTETTFFQDANITITNARFIVGSQTFAMRGITSVQSIEVEPNYTGVTTLLSLSGIVGLLAFTNSLAILAVACTIVFAIGAWWASSLKTSYAVVLRTAGGEVRAYESKDASQIGRIMKALNDSIISHG